MSKNDENQPLLDKDDAKTDYTVESENTGGKFFCIFLLTLSFPFVCGPFEFRFALVVLDQLFLLYLFYVVQLRNV